jgi:proline dehydrogenase
MEAAMGVIDKAIASSVAIIPRPIVKRISSRYIAGENLEDAVATIQELDKEGCVATVDVLGETSENKAEAAEKLQNYKRVLDALDEHDLESGISVKLTGLGLLFDEELCRTNLEEIIEYAAERGRFTRVDMEDSPFTATTIQIVLDLHERHDNVGAVIQAYMRRSLQDVVRLVEAGVTVRLCKGIYDEPRRIAYKNFHTVRHHYVVLLEELLRGGVYVGIATHDEHLVLHALRLIHQLKMPDDRYEFQMLLGVDEELRSILVESGYKVRVYVPFGKEWYEYSTRRLQENPKIARYVAQDVIGDLKSTVDSSFLNKMPAS